MSKPDMLNVSNFKQPSLTDELLSRHRQEIDAAYRRGVADGREVKSGLIALSAGLFLGSASALCTALLAIKAGWV
jgi:hypothetical protein